MAGSTQGVNDRMSGELKEQGCIKPARNAAFMRQRHGNCENLPAKAGVPGQHRWASG
jgi:hypothetical protein